MTYRASFSDISNVFIEKLLALYTASTKIMLQEMIISRLISTFKYYYSQREWKRKREA